MISEFKISQCSDVKRDMQAEKRSMTSDERRKKYLRFQNRESDLNCEAREKAVKTKATAKENSRISMRSKCIFTYLLLATGGMMASGVEGRPLIPELAGSASSLRGSDNAMGPAPVTRNRSLMWEHSEERRPRRRRLLDAEYERGYSAGYNAGFDAGYNKGLDAVYEKRSKAENRKESKAENRKEHSLTTSAIGFGAVVVLWEVGKRVFYRIWK